MMIAHAVTTPAKRAAAIGMGRARAAARLQRRAP